MKIWEPFPSMGNLLVIQRHLSVWVAFVRSRTDGKNKSHQRPREGEAGERSMLGTEWPDLM